MNETLVWASRPTAFADRTSSETSTADDEVTHEDAPFRNRRGASVRLGGFAAIALLGVIALTPVTTTAYAAGAGLMALFLLAYADVHAFGVEESVLGVEFHDHGDHANGHNGENHAHDDGGEGHSHADNGHDHNGEGHSHDHNDNGHGHSHDDGHDGHDHNGRDHSDEGHSHHHAHDGHEGETMTVLADHLLDDAYALAAKTAEAGALVLFAVLALLER